MPAGDVFGLDGFFLNVSNPVVVSTIGINSTAAGAGIAATAGSFSAGTVTLTFSTAAGLTTTPFYTGAKIAVSGIGSTPGIAFTGYNGTFNVTGFAGTTTVSYATTGYVGGVTAGITTTGLVILVTDTQVTNTTWSSAQTHGWFGGGGNPPVSRVDRIDFSNDSATSSPRGLLSLARHSSAATGNSNYGWFGGGYFFPGFIQYSTVDRIDFSNDAATALARGPLSGARYGLGATGNSNYGWFGGGGFPSYSIVNRIDFSNDSATASVRGVLFLQRRFLSATGNSNYGWWGGGYSDGTGAKSTVDRVDFSNDSPTASPRGPLSSARLILAATGNSNYGWFGGGQTVSTVDRIDFSNDLATAIARGPLSSARYSLGAAGNSNYGWFGGGANPAQVSTVDRIDFSNDSAAVSARGPLSAVRGREAATSGQARSSSTRLQKAGNYGWFGGGTGLFPSPSNLTVDRIDFSNDLATASPRGSLTLARGLIAATGNSNYGWFGGGGNPSGSVSYLTVDRIDFSNDSGSTSVRGPLSAAKYRQAATGNSNYGWFGGGSTPAAFISIVDRINFSNDSATASVRGPLGPLSAAHDLAATGNSNYGWFGGGSSSSTITRINFSNDGIAASPRGPLSLGRQLFAATGNSNYGWFGGGNPGLGPGSVATVDRINFSNDSVSASVRGPLLVARSGLTATGNSNYGWFGGGYTPAPTLLITVDRIDFSNDLATASLRGSLSSARRDLAATSNTPT